MASHRRTRFKVLINEYFLTIALVLAVIAAGGAWMTYTTAIASGSHPEQRVTTSWKVNGTFTYSATAVEDSLIFNKGDVRVGRTYYITNATPVLDGQFQFLFTGTTGNATVTTQATLVKYAVVTKKKKPGGSKKTSLRVWEITTPLTTTQQHVTNGETVTTNFTVNADTIRDIKRRLLKLHGTLYQIANIRSSVVVTARLNGTIGGNRVQRTFNYTLPINSTKDYYAISPPKIPPQEIKLTQRVMVPTTPSLLSILGALASLVVPLLALVGLVSGRRLNWFDVSASARDDAKREKLRSEFKEWVTLGTVTPTDDRTMVAVDSLEGLVDVAIDSDRRVIEDTETGRYVVLDTDSRYQFIPEWAEDGDEDDDEDETNEETTTNGEVIEHSSEE